MRRECPTSSPDARRRLWFTPLLCAALLALPSGALAVGLVGFDTARPLAPQHIEASAGFTGGDALYALHARGRIGLLPELEANLAGGLLIADNAFGYEVDLGGKFRFMKTADTAGIVDVAGGGHLSFFKTDDVFTVGIDPQAHASRHWDLPGDREIYVAVTLGLALSVIDVDGGKDDVSFGLLGGLTAGLDVIEDIGFALEGRWRDDTWRFGGAVTVDF